MGKRNDRQRGLMAMELALMLPVLMLIFLMLVEGANAMHVYSELKEASREGARMVLRDGDTSRVSALVDSLLHDLPETEITTNITTDPDGGSITVEVVYEYQSFYGFNPALEALGEESYVFRVRTTMPLP